MYVMKYVPPFSKPSFANIDNEKERNLQKASFNLKKECRSLLLELFHIYEKPRKSKMPLKMLLNVGKRTVRNMDFYDRQDDCFVVLGKILERQAIIYPDIRLATSWKTEYVKKNLDENEVVEQTTSINHYLTIRTPCKNLKDGIKSIFQLKKSKASVRRGTRDVLMNYTEKLTLESDIPPLAIIQLAFRRSYILFGEECLSVKDSRDVIIPKTFEFEGFRFDLNAIICHHGEEASSGHFTCFVNHGDAGFYHHNDDISTKVNIDQCLPHVYGGPGQTSYGVVYDTTSID